MRAPLAAAAAVLLLVVVPHLPDRPPRPVQRLTDLVNPFIGSRDEGNTFPGATVPFGMVQLSPDTGHSTGYDWGQGHIRGFSATHLSGVGCPAGGDLPVLPTTGAVTRTDDARYAAAFRHSSERASPGYYRVGLESYGGITAELTATTRTGWQRYTFPATERANVMLDAGQALHSVVSSRVTVLGARTVATAITGRGFCWGTLPYTLYTVTRFDRPFTGYGTWSGPAVTPGSRRSAGPGLRGAYARFDTRRGHRVTAVTALSWVSTRGALANLAAEGRGGFDATARAARDTWQRRLSAVRVTGGSDGRRRVFYSALYRAFLAPSTGTDTDGAYTGWDGRAHRARGFTYYQNWSLWDTYRTQAQLLSLVAPAESRDMALSLLRVRRDSGRLPKWGYATVETNTMTGDPVTPFLVNAWAQGLLKGHERETYAALTSEAGEAPPADTAYEGRGADKAYLSDGYVPLDPSEVGAPGDPDTSRAASATLEYALGDAALATMADALGRPVDAARLRARGQDYRNILDPRTGWFRARGPGGTFTGPGGPSAGTGFHEGTAGQYAWLVPQDLPGLVSALGGRAAARRRLDAFFAYDRLRADPAGTARKVWVNGPYAYYARTTYNPQNEPDLTAPYAYLSTGQPWKTTDVVHAALTLFTDAPDGVTGNDDLGTMSSWAVLASIGMYPVMPGTAMWGLTTPVFPRVDLTLDRRYYPRGHFTISAPGTSDGARYVRSLSVGGTPSTASWIGTEDVRAGRDLDFTVGTAPSAWGTGAADAPPAVDGVPVPQRRAALSVLPGRTTVAPGRSVRLTAAAVLTAPGTATGTVTASAAGGLTTTVRGGRIAAWSDDLPATTVVAVDVGVPSGTADGTYPVTVRLAGPGGTTAVRTVPVTVGGGFAPPGGP
ncbi:GH92 family glycosyl hydrolase [Streptantibioticus silvisoli]|uniref:GH92 family glycosyl hydrolase n=1 Tax=Streptantibioticus silvisoli TaxID=2705255 RepID=UPI003F6D7985